MNRAIQVAAFGGMVCTIASAALALAPGFRPMKTGFGRRFCFFAWRYSLPAWAVLELVMLALTGRFYP
jgi:hypothetical protein